MDNNRRRPSPGAKSISKMLWEAEDRLALGHPGRLFGAVSASLILDRRDRAKELLEFHRKLHSEERKRPKGGGLSMEHAIRKVDEKIRRWLRARTRARLLKLEGPGILAYVAALLRKEA